MAGKSQKIRFCVKPPKASLAGSIEVLSDQERGGFYASQDADYSLDDDGDYFTWTLDECAPHCSPKKPE